MSMLGSQADSLRLMARLVREYDYKEISRMLREAADTIEALSDKLQGVMRTRYNELFSTPERAARIVVDMCAVADTCSGCPFYSIAPDGVCGDYYAMLEWLRGDVE